MNKSPLSLSVIIPVYNEERTIGTLVEVVRSWAKAKEIIIVNDGSTDRTHEVLAQFSSDITIIDYKKNQGKGYAIEKGTQKSSGDLLMFLDGDLIGLTHSSLDLLIGPIIHGTARMTIGTHMLPSYASRFVFKSLSGERVLYRKDIAPLLSRIQSSGYGLELLLNHAYKHKKVRYVHTPYVSYLMKHEKKNFPEAMMSYIKETRELLTQLLQQQAGDVTPQTKRLFHKIRKYIKQSLDAFS